MRLAVLVFFMLSLVGASVGALEIQEPPSYIEVGEDLDLIVEGMEGIDVGKVHVTYWPSDGVSRCKGVTGWQSGPTLEFRATKEGRYLVHICTSVEGGHAFDEVIINVGPQAPPPLERFLHTVLVVEEKSGQRPYLSVLKGKLLDQWLKSHGQQILLKDKNVKDPVTEDVPKDLAPWFLRAKGKNLPYLFFISEDGGLVWEGGVPKTEEALMEVVKSYTKESNDE